MATGWIIAPHSRSPLREPSIAGPNMLLHVRSFLIYSFLNYIITLTSNKKLALAIFCHTENSKQIAQLIVELELFFISNIGEKNKNTHLLFPQNPFFH